MKQNLKFILNMVTYPIAWKNLSLVYEDCNYAFARLLNLSPKDIIGKKDSQLPWAKIDNNLVNIESNIIETKTDAFTLYYIDAHDFKYYEVIELNQQPLFDEKNNVCGILIRHDNIQYSSHAIINNLFKYKPKQPKNVTLTKREYEILYLLKLGKSAKDIAEFINQIEKQKLSDSTVRSIINKKLYKKFNIQSISELIEIANISHIAKYIPKIFLPK